MSQSVNDLRRAFIQYFEQQGHRAVPSAPLIPQADPTLLFTNAGMNQFKRVFLGEETRAYNRAVTVQKCLRAGGKHNDLENVGYTRRHHTFFEMLGNFSFGDYFKEDAIRFGWEFLTSVVGLSKDRMWITIFREDDEADRLWRKIGVSPSRIVRCGEKDNFWQMADTGPCGPCSELHFDQGPSVPGDATPNGEGDRVIEIWNLVFMQFNRDSAGTLNPLPKPSIDTGMGLERLTAVAQGRLSNYDSDLFAPLLAAIGGRAGAEYGAVEQADRSMRVIADHLRAITFLMADGVLPSNEGRGYVLRRILRRAARHGRLLGITEPFLHELTATVVEQMGEAYHELRPAAGTVAEATRGEEERFIATLDQGLPILNDMLTKVRASGQNMLSGTEIFKLYDTYGFPMDLIAEACREQDIRLDETGFEAAIEEQRTRARKTGGFEGETARPALSEVAARVGTTAFVGYEHLNSEGVVQALLKGDRLVKDAREGDDIEVVLDVTPFYAEGGGQAGDQGLLTGPDGRVEIRETTRPVPTLIVHKGVVTSGSIREGERLQLSVNRRTRHDAARNHTATHLVHAALRDLLGPHVKQYGSLVAPNRLRFDFAHFRPLASRDIDEIESIVNEQVRQDQPVQTDVMGVQEAVAGGALAFFGDKYGDQVRVVHIDTFSKELCGGTHCRRTGEIGLFRIVSESGVAAGVRRIECLTGSGALDSLKRLEADVRELSDLLKVAPGEVVARTRKLNEQLKEKERELAEVKLKMASTSSGDAQAREIKGVQVHAQRTDGLDVNGMRALADQLRDKLRSGVVALGAANDGKVSLLVVVTKDLVGRLKAGELIKEMATEVGGTGGGRPEMAQAGGKNPEGLGTALEKVFGLVQKALEG
ncbi:MAG: alanine--tRNA ligase [Nitrospira sp.]|mgnify:FL=1|jgi:alanyl-tRNA synthetase|uniref:alanine--tRNA ligase n=1 Tax=Nitrospira sp. ND1 TaxID=1658518 RepID=UPI0009BBC8B0|nr:alanine--tRNA ligase [Nitrospira sp.]OYT24980.1 MAG: alanine--tRNA ligase [Nitrospira sp. UW-LDO-02]SLM42811.1 alanyl-tRNA synthetase [Nitrospira sp. ND1]MBK9996976.1 alanine--tRNA ligase [Nitrospira sp.]MBP6198890.1 alanine--tRNA ligase [Nitrospira sp.]